MSGGCVGDTVVLPGDRTQGTRLSDYRRWTHSLRFAMVHVAKRRPATSAFPSLLSTIVVGLSVRIVHFVLARGDVAKSRLW